MRESNAAFKAVLSQIGWNIVALYDMLLTKMFRYEIHLVSRVGCPEIRNAIPEAFFSAYIELQLGTYC